MKVLFELSGEHPKLASAEVTAVLEAEKIKYSVVDFYKSILVVDLCTAKQKLHRLAERIAFLHNIDILKATTPFEKISVAAEKIDLKKRSKFCVRVKRVNKLFSPSNSMMLQKQLGELIRLKKNAQVSLNHYDTEIRAIAANKCYLTVKHSSAPRGEYELRKAQYRPFFLPTTIHPRYARCLVNLARVNKKDIFLDPFCGTGGILLEAALIGARIIGNDIDKRILEGCHTNLDAYGVKMYKAYNCDISSLKNIGLVDCIATDPPYGRAARVVARNRYELYEDTFETFTKILKKNRYLAIILPDRKSIKLGANYMVLKNFHPVRVHKSLTRFFTVYTNS